MKGALVLHGEAPSASDLALLRDCDLVVAADGGALHLFGASLVPDLIVGDLDGLGPQGIADAQHRGVPLQRHDPRKDQTDGELALEALLAEGPAEVLILGAHGGRTAHALANLHLLRRCLARGVPARMVGRGEELRLLGAGQRWDLGAPPGRLVNVLAEPPEARVLLRGLAWSGAVTLGAASARGVSNRVVDADAAVEVEAGAALVVLEAQ